MKSQKVLVVLNGNPPCNSVLSWRYEEADLTIAVDGGWITCRQADLYPEVLIGDMDSLGEDPSGMGIPSHVKIIDDKNQNQSDFQKAINFILSKIEPSEIVLLGFLGNRTDHLINNFSLISEIPDGITITIDSETEWVRRVTGKQVLQVKGNKGATISLVPFELCKSVSTVGLKWNLDGEDLSFGGLTSISNVISSNFSEISVQSGSLFTIIQK